MITSTLKGGKDLYKLHTSLKKSTKVLKLLVCVYIYIYSDVNLK